MPICNDCPRQCGVQRPLSAKDGENPGFCAMPFAPTAARAALHYHEEPCISGTRGSGAVFFSGCPLGCVFCQNASISAGRFGRELGPDGLRRIYRRLIEDGAHNINLVSASHFLRAVCQSLDEPLPVPVVYNCGGYESIAALRKLEGKVQVYLPDLKYLDISAAARYSAAPDYPEVAQAAILEMVRQTGPYRLDEEGMLLSGVLIRHLVLPGQTENSKRVIDWVADTFAPKTVLFSLMSQYIPCGQASDFPEIDRPLSRKEYDEVEAHLFARGIEDGFLQELSSADPCYIPEFDLTGVETE